MTYFYSKKSCIINELTDAKGADTVIETVGTSQTFVAGANCLSIGGYLSITALYSKQIVLPINKLCMKTIKNNMELAYLDDMNILMKMIKAGKINTSKLITHHKSSSQVRKHLMYLKIIVYIYII